MLRLRFLFSCPSVQLLLNGKAKNFFFHLLYVDEEKGKTRQMY